SAQPWSAASRDLADEIAPEGFAFGAIRRLESMSALSVRRLPLGARQPGSGPPPLSRRPRSGRILPRRRARSLVAAGTWRTPPVAGRGAVRRSSRPGRDRRRRLRRGIRIDGRRGAALVAAAALRPRRLRRA